MKPFIQQLHRNRAFTLLVWLIVVFIAIITAPSFQNAIQSYSQPVLSSNSQPMQAQSIRDEWGYQLKGTNSVDVVYNNPNGKITPIQQNQIDSTIQNLTQHQSFYSVKKITSTKTNMNGQSQMLSSDGSTEYVTIDMDAKGNSLQVLVNQLVSQTKVTGLNSYITSPEIIREEQNTKIAQVSKIVMIVMFIASALLLGIYFRSLLAAVVSFISTFSAFIVSFGFSYLLQQHFNWAYGEYVPLEIGLLTVILGSIWNIFLFRRFRAVLEQDNDGRKATQETVGSVWMPITIVAGCLAFIFALSGFINFNQIQQVWTLAFTVLVLALSVLTLNAVFMQPLARRFYWPGNSTLPMMDSHYYTKATQFALWQPIFAVLIAIYLTLPFVYFYRSSLSYSPDSNLTQSSQAVSGAQVLNSHFTGGKSAPITVYIQSNNKLANEKYLSAIDILTTKLQSTPGINKVYSITQPGGIPIQKYYVATQLQSIGMNAKLASGQLADAVKGIKSNQNNLKTGTIQSQISSINSQINQVNQLQSKTQTIQGNVSKADQYSTATVRSKISSTVMAYQRQIEAINSQLQSVSSDLNTLISTANQIKSSSQGSSAALTAYSKQIQNVRNELGKVGQKVSAAQTQINNIYNYLSGLENSQAADVFYITKAQLADTDFIQTTLNYTSQDQKITSLQIVLNSQPNSQNNVQTINTIEQQIHLQLQGTPLAHAKVAITGEPVVQSIIQQKMQDNLWAYIVLLIAGLSLAVFFFSRAVLQPLYWTLAFIISGFTGIQLTSLTMEYVGHITQLDWPVPIIAASILAAIGTWQIASLGMSKRRSGQDLMSWAEPAMLNYGKEFRYILMIIVLMGISLTFGASTTLIELAMILIFTAGIFYLILPITVAAVGKISVLLPQRKNIWFRNKKHD